MRIRRISALALVALLSALTVTWSDEPSVGRELADPKAAQRLESDFLTHLLLPSLPLSLAYTDLAQGANVNAKDARGTTALHEAVFGGSKELIALLLEKGAHVNAKNDGGASPLHWAASSQDKSLVQVLLDNGAEVNAKDDMGLSSLHLAAAYGNEHLVAILLSNGADVNARDNFGETALHGAAVMERRRIQELLPANGADPEIRNNDGKRPLECAASVKAVFPSLWYLKIPQEFHGKPSNPGSSPLHWAASSQDKSLVQVLLDNGAEVNAKDDVGLSPLHIAATNGNEHVVAILLSSGADINAKDHLGRTPLHLSICARPTRIPKLMLARGAEVNAKDDMGLSSLHLAAAYGNEHLVAILLSNGADVNARDNFGETALHGAAVMERRRIQELLLANGADPEIRNNDGKRPLECAASVKAVFPSLWHLEISREFHRELSNPSYLHEKSKAEAIAKARPGQAVPFVYRDLTSTVTRSRTYMVSRMSNLIDALGEKPPWHVVLSQKIAAQYRQFESTLVKLLLIMLRYDEAWQACSSGKLSSSRASETAQTAAFALGEIGEPAKEAVPTLIFLLQSGNRDDVLIAAAWALGAIGQPARDALPALALMLEDGREYAHPGVRLMAEAAINQITGKGSNIFRRLEEKRRSEERKKGRE